MKQRCRPLCIVCNGEWNETFLDIYVSLHCSHVLHVACLFGCILHDQDIIVCPECFDVVDRRFFKNVAYALFHSLETDFIIENIGVSEYELIYPREKYDVTRKYIKYPFVLSDFQKAKIRVQRFEEMTKFIRKVSLVHWRLANVLRLPTPMSYK